MKKAIKWISLLLAVIVIASAALTGCGTKSAETKDAATVESTAAESSASSSASGDVKPETSEEVNIRYYHIGAATPFKDEVLKSLNDKLKAKINTTLEVNYLSWGDAWTKAPLLFASGEDFDMIFCAPWFFFADQGKKGAYKELNDILPKYAPKMWAEAPKLAWEQASIDGKIYAIPQYMANTTDFYGVGYREDLRKKYNVPEIKKVTDFEPFFAAIKKNEPKMMPWAVSGGNPALMDDYIRENTNLTYSGTEGIGFMYDMMDPNPKVTYKYMLPQVDEWAVIAKKWADAGYWSKNALSNKVSDDDAYTAGTSAIAAHETYQINTNYKKLKEKDPNSDTGFYINLSKDGKTNNIAYFQNGVAINNNSKHPERAAMLVETLLYDPEIYEAGVFGIEGKTFVKDNNGNYASVPNLKAEESWGFGSLYGMGISNYKLEKLDTSKDHPLFLSQYHNPDYLKQFAVDCALTSFVPDNTNINAELAAINDVSKIYAPVITLGLTKDPAATLVEFRKKLKDAGLDKVTTEIQKQVDAYIAAHKK